MSYTLVIVESPAKCDKIEKYLGPGYKCIASFGHLQQLLSLKDLDVNNGFKPLFTPIESKKQQIERIKNKMLNAKEVVLATDDDREGEGIAWHICQLFDLSIESTKRIIFHEVTEKGLKDAIRSPTTLNMNIVNAQQGRQILDLIVGYKISPDLWQNISRKKGLSAGRCQTPALRLIYDNQKEIDESPGKLVYNTTGYFTSKNYPFILNYQYDNEDKMGEFLEESVEYNHKLSLEKTKKSLRKAPTPFTTSSLQQTSSNDLHISPKETMSICQKLYEAGYITYMRTDSKIYSKEFVLKTFTEIEKKYGEKYKSERIEELTTTSEKGEKKTKKGKKKDEEKNNAQEAHEAIRPTQITISNLPEDSDFTNREKKMYNLIWRNTICSCMSDAIYLTMLAKISAPFKYEYRYTCEELEFDGWKILDKERGISILDEKANEAYNYLPKIKDNEVNYNKITCKSSMKELKMHYTEAKLVQLLEQKGIGRPSTFSSLIEKIQERGYVKKDSIKGKKIKCLDFELVDNEINEIETDREFGNENNKLVMQPVGKMVIEFLINKYNNIFEYDYTKQMEDKLDEIAKGEMEYQELCKECLESINKELDIKGEQKEIIQIDEDHIYMIGKNGPVIRKGEKTFISVRDDIDIDKLREGGYKLGEIIKQEVNRKLGKYENKDIVLKRGKFGLYVEWGENKKSLNGINKNENNIELNDVIEFITSSGNINLVRELRKDLSIRKGKYGDYIFYKTEKMKTPKFLKLTGFNNDYKNCDKDLLLRWINETYKV